MDLLLSRVDPVRAAHPPKALRLIDARQWASVASMMLDYYDKLYRRSQDGAHAAGGLVVTLACPTADPAQNTTLAQDAARRVLCAG